MEQRGGIFNVRDFGAAGDGHTLDSPAIDRAIEACAGAGGGTVRFPPGVYLSGTLHLRSHLTLLFEAGAELLGSPLLEHYSALPREQNSPWQGGPLGGLLVGVDLEDLTLLGPGGINGNDVYDMNGEENMRGPHTVRLHNCRRVAVRNLAVRNAANYAFFITGCVGLDVNGLKVTGGWDGIHLWNGRDVTIFGCSFQTGDDALAGQYWENVSVANCLLNSSCNGIRIIGPVRNVRVSDCLIHGPGTYPHRTARRTNSLAGIQITPGTWMESPGETDDVLISNVAIANVRTPFWIGTVSADSPIGRITISHVTATGAGRVASVVEGVPGEHIQHLVLRDVSIETEGSGTEDAWLPFAERVMDKDPWNLQPVSGLYCRHVRLVDLQNVRISHRDWGYDVRPALVCRDVVRLVMENVVVPLAANGFVGVVLENVEQVLPSGTELPVIKASAGERDGGTAAPSFASGSGSVAYSDLRVEPYSRQQWDEVTVFGTGWPLEFEPYLYEHFTARATLRNLSDAEVREEVQLRVDGLPCGSQAVTLGSEEAREVLFSQAVPKPGPHTIGIGPLPALPFTVLGEVEAPYRTAANVDAAFRQGGVDGDGVGRLYVRAGGRNRMDLNDDYGAIYLPGALHERGALTVKVERVDPGSGLRRARIGLMARNDIAQPGASTGYVIMAMSICNGWALEWDADGDGRLDGHTDFAGYTMYPAWLRLERDGNTFSGSYSLDGKRWTRVGSAEVPGAAPALDAGVFTSRGMACFEGLKVENRE